MKRIPAASALAATWAALGPSLVPRTWWMTAINVGMNAIAGQKCAEAAGVLRRLLPGRRPEHSHSVDGSAPRGSLLLLAAAVGTGLAVQRSAARQREICRITGTAVQGSRDQFIGFAAGTAGWLAFDAVLRATADGRRLLTRRIHRRLPVLPEAVIAAASTVAIAYAGRSAFRVSINRMAARAAVSDFARAAISAHPLDPERSGSPHSQEPFATLGFHGRGFVSGGPRAARISQVMRRALDPQDTSEGTAPHAVDDTAPSSGAEAAPGSQPGFTARTPIRVFIGRLGHPDSTEAARAAVAELERTGAFERSALLLVTTTGSGWIPHWSVETFEHVTGGDCATAALQYSFAGSWLAFLLHRTRSEESATALHRAVADRLAQCPAGHRPRLYATGESLGSLGGHGAFDDVEHMRRSVDGALWTGTPRTTPIHSRLTASRRAGSPEIRPAVGDGSQVRFVTRPADLEDHGTHPPAPWQGARILYAQHPSDPVVWWEPQLIWRRPDWLAEPRGHGVSPAVQWLPWIAFWQLTTDMPNSVKLPGGHGHSYHRETVAYWNEILDAGLSSAACARVGDAIAEDLGPRSGSLPLMDPGPWQAGAMESRRRSPLAPLSALAGAVSSRLFPAPGPRPRTDT